MREVNATLILAKSNHQGYSGHSFRVRVEIMAARATVSLAITLYAQQLEDHVPHAFEVLCNCVHIPPTLEPNKSFMMGP